MKDVYRGNPGLVIDVWSDFVCPFCYMGVHRLNAGITMWGGHGDVIYRSFSLMADLAPGSDIDFLAMFGAQRNLAPVQVQAIVDGVTAQAATLGLELHLERARATNTQRAQELSHFAKYRGRQAALAERIFRAYFTDGLLISDVDVLAALAAEVGLDPLEAADAIARRRFKPEVQTDIAAARQAGVSSVPHIVIDSDILIGGGQTPEMIADSLRKASTRRPGSRGPVRRYADDLRRP